MASELARGLLTLLVAACFLDLLGCASTSAPSGSSEVRGAEDPRAPVWLVPPDTAATGTTRMLLHAVPEPGHAPVPVNDAERLLFAHLYVGPTEVTPDGSVVPLLVERVTARDELLWDIRLRPGLRFSDGTSLRAVDVAKSWALARTRHPERDVWRQFDPGLVRAQGFQNLLVRTREPGVDLPRLLADPAFRVVSPGAEGSFPAGAGVLAIVGASPGAEIRLEPNRWYPGFAPVEGETWLQPPPPDELERRVSSGRLPGEAEAAVGDDGAVSRRPFHCRIEPGADARDAAGSTADDALVVRGLEDCRFLEIAGYVDHPLPYDRGYVLLVAGPTPSTIDRVELAELIVTEDARPWTEIEVVESFAELPTSNEVVVLRPGATGFGGVLSDALPEAARIASRLAATWSATVVERGNEEPHQPLRAGQALVVPVERTESSAGLSSLLLHWLDLEGEAEMSVVSLLESRPHLLLAPAVRGVHLDGRGVPRFEKSSTTRPADPR